MDILQAVTLTSLARHDMRPDKGRVWGAKAHYVSHTGRLHFSNFIELFTAVKGREEGEVRGTGGHRSSRRSVSRGRGQSPLSPYCCHTTPGRIRSLAPVMIAAVAVGRTAVVVVDETGSVPFAPHSRIRREFYSHANRNDHQRRTSVCVSN